MRVRDTVLVAVASAQAVLSISLPIEAQSQSSSKFYTSEDEIADAYIEWTNTENITTNSNASVVLQTVDEHKYVQLSEINSKSLDWVELYNPSNHTIDLRGAYLQGKDSEHIYNFTGECGEIDAGEYMLLVDSDTTNLEFRNKDCMLEFGIKSSGSLTLYDAEGKVRDTTSWENAAYVTGNSWARDSENQWRATSTHTILSQNIFTEEITLPSAVNLTNGLADRELAYIQNPPFGSVTQVNLFVQEWSRNCTCNQFQHAHNDEQCDCSWTDVLEDSTSTDLSKIVMPCSVSISVDGVPEFWYQNVTEGNTTVLKPRMEDNCNVAVRGGFTRQERVKSYNIKFSKTQLPSSWRGLKRLNMVKTPWEEMGGALTASMYEQFAKMNDFVGMRTSVANLTISVIDQDSGKVVRVENQGRYVLMENWDDEALDRHGLASINAKGKRQEAHVYKLNSMDFAWRDKYEHIAPSVDETNETAIYDFEQHLEAKDSDDNTKLYETLMALNLKTNLTFVEAVHKHFDLNNLARWLAVGLTCGDSDHQGKNQYIYSTEGTDVWYFTPWDYDACWNVVMDNGPPSVSISLYETHFLFKNIMYTPELREEFYPLVKATITELRAGLFERSTIEGVLAKHGDVVYPFMQPGQTDRDVLYNRPYNYTESEGNVTFSPYEHNSNVSPLNNTMSQYDFIMDALDNYTFSDAPPTYFGDVKLRKIEHEHHTFDIKIQPLFSPIGNDIDTFITFYKNQPVFKSHGGGDDEHTIFDFRFWEPKVEDVVYEMAVPHSINKTAHELSQEIRVPINCSEVEECKDDSCHVSVYTRDLVTNMTSAYAQYEGVLHFTSKQSNCHWHSHHEDAEKKDEEKEDDDSHHEDAEKKDEEKEEDDAKKDEEKDEEKEDEESDEEKKEKDQDEDDEKDASDDDKHHDSDE